MHIQPSYQEHLTEDIYQLAAYDYDLPTELIAKHPVEPRDAARLLVMDRETGALEDRVFCNIGDYLNPGDALVINETRVIPARLLGYKTQTGAKVEILLLNRLENGWEALVRPAKRLPAGTEVTLTTRNQTPVKVFIEQELPFAGGRLIQFFSDLPEDDIIDQCGEIPLPPYMGRPAEERDLMDYQTVYARCRGSVAAPTAGLHFTEQLLDTLKNQGVQIIKIILQVGIGTFRPVSVPDIRDHQMHYEKYWVEEQAAKKMNAVRAGGHKIVAVGTTVVRTLETIYDPQQGFVPGNGETNKFIYPGYRYQAIDALITNFHLPQSTLLMLVSAFAGREHTLAAYRHAVEKRYRFFSYGDAMFITSGSER